jgi:hypothetical protein
MIKWDRRKTSNLPDAQTTELPVDYLRLVESTLTEGAAQGLAELKKIHPICEFSANGAIYGDEVFLAITLSHGTKNLSATTVYASADFNPSAEKPGLETILNECFEAAGAVFLHYLDLDHSERIAQIAHHSISALEEAPFEWATQSNSDEPSPVTVWVKIDKSNPMLDYLTEKWLIENDPEYKATVVVEKETNFAEAEDFLGERIDAIKKAGSTGGSQ